MKKRKSTNLHIERARHKLSQNEFAKKLKVTRQTVINIENGKSVPNILFALKTLQIFEKPIEYLFNNY